MQLTIELHELAVTKLYVIHTSMPPPLPLYSLYLITLLGFLEYEHQQEFSICFKIKKKTKTRTGKHNYSVCAFLFVCVYKCRTEHLTELVLRGQTFWPVVGVNVTSTGWDTDSNILPPKELQSTE